MASIKECLEKILSARYGKDVRQAIHDSIDEINSIASTAQDSAASMATIATEAKQSAKQSELLAKQYAEQAFTTTPEGYNELIEDVGLLDIQTTTERTLKNSLPCNLKINSISGASIVTDSQVIKSVDACKITSKNKNWLPYPYYETTHVEDGIEWVDNGDGTVAATGVATASSVFNLTPLTNSPLVVPKGKYKLVGCPSGYGNQLRIRVGLGENATFFGQDYGSGLALEVAEETIVSLYLEVLRAGTVVDNVIFKPMLIPEDVEDDTWEQQKKSLIDLSLFCPLRAIGEVKDTIANENGTFKYTRNIGVIESYNGEDVGEVYMSSTGGLDTGATVLYALKNPTVEELGDYYQEVLNSLETYSGVTYLSTESEVEPIIEVDYATSTVGAVALESYKKTVFNAMRTEEVADSLGWETEDILLEENIPAGGMATMVYDYISMAGLMQKMPLGIIGINMSSSDVSILQFYVGDATIGNGKSVCVQVKNNSDSIVNLQATVTVLKR